MVEDRPPKPLIWIGSSRRDLRAMPDAVQSRIGYALYAAQLGGKHRDAKPLRGFGGAGIIEIVTDHHGDAYRCSLRLCGSLCDIDLCGPCVSKEVQDRA